MLLGSSLAQLLQIPFLSKSAHDATCGHTLSGFSRTSTYSPLNQDFESLINQTMLRYHVPGLAVAILSGDETFSQVSHSFQYTSFLQR
jgi:hypothetical protein